MRVKFFMLYLMNLASGTSANPQAAPMTMIMTPVGEWQTMLMGTAFLVDSQQSGSRGGDKFYSTNWFMASAQHAAGQRATFEITGMFSLEPATVTNQIGR